MSERREYCFICGKIDKENDIALFRVPTGKLEEWQKQIRRPGLRKSSLLCEVHFEDSEIDRGPVIQNELHRAPRRHLISKNVIPTKHLETPDFHTPKRKRQPLRPSILNVGAPAGGPRVRSNAPCVRRQKSQNWPTSLAAAAVSTLFLESPSSGFSSPGSQLECEAMDSPSQSTRGSSRFGAEKPGSITLGHPPTGAFGTSATTQPAFGFGQPAAQPFFGGFDSTAQPFFCGFDSTAPSASGQTPTTSAPAYNLSQTAATPSFGFGAQQATDVLAIGGQQNAGATSGFDTQLLKTPPAFSFTPQSTATTSATNTLSFSCTPAPTFRKSKFDFGAQQPTSSLPLGGAATTPVATSSGLPFGQTSEPQGGLNYGQPPSTSTSSGGLNFGPALTALNCGQPASTGRSFGATPTNSAGGLSFGQSTAATPSTAAASTPSTAVAPTAFRFCQPSATTPASSAPPAYSFNNTAPTPSSTGCSLAQPVASTAPAGSGHGLSAPTVTAPPAFGASTGGLPSFGSTPTTSAGLSFGAPSPGSIPSATTPASSAPPAFQLGGTSAASSLGAPTTSTAPTTSATPPPNLGYYFGSSSAAKTTVADTTVSANPASLSVTNTATSTMPSTVHKLSATTTRNDTAESRLEVEDMDESFSSFSARNNQSYQKETTPFTASIANGSTDDIVPVGQGSVSNNDALPNQTTIESSRILHDQSSYISDSLHHNNCGSTGRINEDGTPSNIPQFSSTPKSKENKSKKVQVKHSRGGINSHANCNGCNKFLSISARKKNSLLKKNPSGSCPKCFWYDQKLKQKSKIIKLQKQTIARLTSYIENMAGKIAQFQERLESLTEKSLERRISHLKPLGLKYEQGNE